MNNFFLITGNDLNKIKEAASSLLNKLGEGKNNPLDIEIYRDSGDKSLEEVMEEALISLSTPPFLGIKKTIALEKIPFPSPKSKSEHRDQSPSLLRHWAKLLDYCTQGLPEDINLVIIAPEI